MWELINTLGTFAGLGGLLAVALFWLIGGSSVAKIGEEAARILRGGFEALLPGVQAIAARLWAAVTWAWDNVVWVGLKDIGDNLATIVTVLLMGLMLAGYMRGIEAYRVAEVQSELNVCIADLKKARRNPPAMRPKPSPAPTFKWPWE